MECAEYLWAASDTSFGMETFFRIPKRYYAFTLIQSMHLKNTK